MYHSAVLEQDGQLGQVTTIMHHYRYDCNLSLIVSLVI